MSLEIMTKSDLIDFKSELFKELKLLFSSDRPASKKWLRSNEVKKLLAISSGTLQTLRNKGTLSFTKIGGTMYYSMEEINKVLQHSKSPNSSK
ncbi:helix-turn-helix domain-containing protein [Pedobacter aquatilis]|uniref:helix-turn-helix domain-containing protein n=1 Tax=Pedobacter aquatilis TaxID=351343 RepID=UPI00292F3ACA|nr:helix-turn-helix domain-containing protein [Pedobacter aquatilis]